jgi:DNA-binding GntR family transcriptional regulator
LNRLNNTGLRGADVAFEGKVGRLRTGSIYETIRDRICLLEYPPGMMLHEERLAGEFSVSRTPIREALQRLEFEGLVRTRNGVGTIVTGVDFNSFKDVYELRLKIAELIGEMSPRPCTAADITFVESLLARAKKLNKSGDATEFWRVNHELQHQITQHIGNKALRWIHDLFYFQTARIWFNVVADMWDEEVKLLCSELTDVLRAMRAGDLNALGYIRRNYIALGMIRITHHLSGLVPPGS